MRSARHVVCAVLLGAFVPTPAGAQPPNDDVTRIVARWGQLKRAAPAVSYVVRWERFPSDLKPDAPKPGEDGAYTGSALVVLDPARKRLRIDVDEIIQAQNRPRPSRVRTMLRYDGSEQSSSHTLDLDAAEAPVEPVFRSVELGPWGESVRCSDEFNPLFWGHGLIRTSRTNELPFDWRAKPGQFHLVRREEFEGRTCVVLHDATVRPETKEMVWVDDERGLIVRRRGERKSGGGDEMSIRYQETPHGWLPQTWERSDLQPGRPPVVRARFRVEAVTFDPVVSDDDFRIALRPEMNIRRNGFPIHVRDDGTIEPGPAGPTWSDMMVTHVRTWARRIGWLGLCGVLLSTVLIGLLVRLRMQRKVAGS